MQLRTLLLLTVALPALALPCRAQRGTVIFYFVQPGLGQEVADGLLPVGSVAFTGFLYDGSQKMAHAKGGRFAIFRLPVGEHQFSASYRKLSPGDPAVHIELADGGSYCVRLSATLKSGSPLVPFGITHSVIEQVPCDQASKEAGKYKPLEMKLVDPDATGRLVSSETFPQFNR
jgi:hypothetical protein